MKGTTTSSSYLPAGTNTSNNNNTHDCPSRGDHVDDVDDDDISTLNTSTSTSSSTRTTKNLLGTLDGRRLATLDGRRLATLDGRRVKGLCSALTSTNTNSTSSSDPRLIKAKEFMERGAGKLRRRASSTTIKEQEEELSNSNRAKNDDSVPETNADMRTNIDKTTTTTSSSSDFLQRPAKATASSVCVETTTDTKTASTITQQQQPQKRPSSSPRYIKESKLIKSLKKTDPDKYKRYFDSIQDGSRHKKIFQRKSPLKTKRTTMPSTSIMESSAAATTATALRRVESVPISLSLSQDDEDDDDDDDREEKEQDPRHVEKHLTPQKDGSCYKRTSFTNNIDVSGSTCSNKQDTKLIHEATVEAEVTFLNRSMSSSALMDYFGNTDNADDEGDDDEEPNEKVRLQIVNNNLSRSHHEVNKNDHQGNEKQRLIVKMKKNNNIKDNDDDENDECLLDKTGRPSSLVFFDDDEEKEDGKRNHTETGQPSSNDASKTSSSRTGTTIGLTHLSNTWHKAYSVIYRPSSDPASVALRQRGLLILTKFQIWFISTNQNLFEISIDWNTITKCEPWSSLIDGWLSGGGGGGTAGSADGVKNDNSAADGGVVGGGGEGSFIKISTKTSTKTRQPPTTRASTLSSLDRSSKRPAATTAKEFIKQKVVSTLSSSPRGSSDEVNKYYFRFYKDNHLNEAMDIINTTIRMLKEEATSNGLQSVSPAPAPAATTTTTKVEPMTMKKQHPLPPVPPDPVLSKMTIVANRIYNAITLKEFQNLFLFANDKDGGEMTTTKTTTTPNDFLYKFYQTHNKFDIVIPSEWTYSETKGEWCGESYTHCRVVTFKEHKQIPLQGMCLVSTESRQHLRMNKSDRIILMQTLQMTGIPYSDTFCIIVRLVATRHGLYGEDVSVEVGIHVDFKKTNIMSGKIKSNVLENMKLSQTAFLESVQDEVNKRRPSSQNEEVIVGIPNTNLSKNASLQEQVVHENTHDKDKELATTTATTSLPPQSITTMQRLLQTLFFDKQNTLILGIMSVMVIVILVMGFHYYLVFNTTSAKVSHLEVGSDDPTNLLQHQLGMLNKNLTQLLLQTKQFVELKQELRDEMQHAQNTLLEIQQLLG